MPRQRTEYVSFRRNFEPTSVKLVVVAESPPASGKYFYKLDGKVSEPLFSALMKRLDCIPTSKEEGLREFQRRGWVLVDATYEPVNGPRRKKKRDDIILRAYPQLRSDLDKLLTNKLVPVILIKANICHLLEQRLMEDGFNVINKQRVVYFPSNGWQKDFHRQFSEILKSSSIS